MSDNAKQHVISNYFKCQTRCSPSCSFQVNVHVPTLICEIVKLISASRTFPTIYTLLAAADTTAVVTLQTARVHRVTVTRRTACSTAEIKEIRLTAVTLQANHIFPTRTLSCLRMARTFICTNNATGTCCQKKNRNKMMDY